MTRWTTRSDRSESKAFAMKLSVLCAGLGRPHAGWTAIDELAVLLARYLDADLLSPQPAPVPWWLRWRSDHQEYHQPILSSGGDVLLVVARGPGDLGLLRAIPDVHRKFSKIYAWVTDSYFQAGFGRITGEYDAITVTAHEDTAFVQQRFGIAVHQLYQGTDALTWAPRQRHARDIDLIAFGRTPQSYHRAFVEHFHTPTSPHLYLHSPLGHLNGKDVHQERSMLLKLLQRTRVSLAFHLYVEPEVARPRSMMVTSRWLESLVAGCIVAGKRPISRMADEMLCWDQATVELPDDPAQAVEAVQLLLANDERWDAQRHINIRNVLERHDWRDRILTLCHLFGIPIPERLHDDLEQLQAFAKTWN